MSDQINIETHTCKKCSRVLPKTAFTKSSNMKQGHLNSCKECDGRAKREYARIRRLMNPEGARAKDRLKYAKNREKRKEESRSYRARNHEKVKEQGRNRYHADKEYYRKQSLDYRNRNKETCQERSREWYKENKDRASAYVKDRYHSNEQAKLRLLISGRILKALKEDMKSQSTLDLLGCTVEEAKKHLESLWQPGMTWENHGKWIRDQPMTWHIDHIRPCASFDLSDPEQQRVCFHYTNLQPLWAIDNIIKGDKVNHVN